MGASCHNRDIDIHFNKEKMTAQTQIILKYGLPGRDYLNKYCEMWDISKDFPWTLNITIGQTQNEWKRIYINKDFKVKLHSAFTNIQKCDLQGEIKTFDGCYVERNVRGRNAKSLHSWALAIDLNAKTEYLGRISTDWSPRFVAIMKAAGIYWGGDWKGRKDNQHFALFNG